MRPPTPKPRKRDPSEARPLSATNVRTAMECPRLFYLGKRQGGGTQFRSSDLVRGVGQPFHDWVDRWVKFMRQDSEMQILFQPDSATLSAPQVAQQIQQHFFKTQFLPVLEGQAEQHEEVTRLQTVWQGLQGVIQHLTELLVRNRYHCDAEEVFAQTLLHARPLRATFVLPDQTQQVVHGSFDCLTRDLEQQRHVVIELKTYHSPDPAVHLAQAALYSFLLWDQRQVPVDAAVYCVLPTFKVYSYRWEDLKATVHERIPHKLQQMQRWLAWQPGQPDPPPPTAQPQLCQICPQAKKCQTFFDPEIAVDQTKAL